ncbi:hypothetical protein KY289_016365 [Solanum tuberosum]|nr:hypothetical protein KY289_016365 [Solanum tuberosum]
MGGLGGLPTIGLNFDTSTWDQWVVLATAHPFFLVCSEKLCERRGSRGEGVAHLLEQCRAWPQK